MDLTTHQTYILICIALAELTAGLIIYVTAGIRGFKRGRRSGYRDGIDAATEHLQGELDEMTARCNSAERLLTATGAELRRLKDNHARAMQDAREAYEAQSIQLADAQMLNDTHARLLRQSAGKLDHVATPLQRLGLTDDARQVVTIAEQLRSLAGWLKPQTQTVERAA